MEKYPLSVLQTTLIEWKYAKRYAHELKTFEVKDKLNGELDIVFNSKIRIVNSGGSFDLKAEPAKFRTSNPEMASFDSGTENELLKDFLRNFDNEFYIRAEQNESNTVQHKRFFEK